MENKEKREEDIKLDPKQYGLPARTHLEKRDGNVICLIIRRKSRIIMADGRKLVEKAKRIQQLNPSVTVGLATTTPICSKTRELLNNAGVTILEE